MSDRQKLFFALVVSALVHLAIGLVLASWSARHFDETAEARPDRAQAQPDLSQLEVTIMPPGALAPTPAPVLAAAPTPIPLSGVRPDVDSDGLTQSTKAPAHAVFQSDANMVAGSKLPATGNEPLPSEDGPRRKFEDFANVPASIGKGQQPSSPRKPSPQRQAQSAQPPPPPPAPALAQADQTPSTPVPTPKPTPTPAADTLALGRPPPTPPPPSRFPTPIAELARLNTPPPLRATPEMAAPDLQPEPQSAPPAPEASTQREMEKTRIDGGITARGEPGVDAVETPYGRYHRKLSNLIGSRWQLYLQQHPKDVGDVTILVKLDTRGKVTATRVIANHSMDDLAELSTRAIMESDLPPVPDDLAPMLRDGKLEITFNFNVYDPSNDTPGR